MNKDSRFAEIDRLFDALRARVGAVETPVGGPIDQTEPFGSRRELAEDGGPTGGGRDDSDVNLTKRGSKYVFVADLPGFETHEIDLSLEDDTLLVVAETTQTDESRRYGDELRAQAGVTTTDGEEQTTDAGVHTRSRRVFERVSLPERVEADDATASYRDDVLEVHLPLVNDVTVTKIDLTD